MRVLVLGSTGMLGYSLFANLSEYDHLQVFGTVRTVKGKEHYFPSLDNIVTDVDVTDIDAIETVLEELAPDIVLNCIGLIKQHEVSKQHISAIEINALLPHKLAELCERHDSRLIHFSTDCVFDGQGRLYSEDDIPNATDLYGKSKCLGEVNYGRHLTLRTSIIGHELTSSVSLVDWFLNQDEVQGYSKAVFSGLPTCYIAKLLAESIFDKPNLTGLYHLSVEPIDKYTLLSLIAEIYKKNITIKEYSDFVIDRSLDSSRFRNDTGFVPPSWQDLIEYMNKDYIKRYLS